MTIKSQRETPGVGDLDRRTGESKYDLVLVGEPKGGEGEMHSG